MFKELILKRKIKVKIKNLKKSASSESGRSMVEMLGVLAIMGILSIGAIAGYRYAIDSYKANETINELTLRAVSVGEQVRQNKGTLTMDEFPATTRQGYPVTAFREPDDPKLFELEVTNVPVGVCQKILKMGWKLPVLIKANEIVYGGNDLICEPSEMDNRETATMVFLFDEDMDETALPNWYCEKDSDCGSCQRCQENICVSSCEGYERCAQDTETGEQICCPKERRSGPYCCSKAVNGMCCNENDQCCPWYKPLIGKDGSCYTCDNEGGVNVTGVEENCGVCENRELWEKSTSETHCVISCPTDKPLRGSNGQCYSCDEETPVNISHIPSIDRENYCKKRCSKRFLNGSNDYYCSLPCKEGTFTGEDGKCYSCDENKSILITNVLHDGCERCDNRQQFDRRCVLKCPIEKPLRSNEGNCYSCDTEEIINVYLSSSSCQQSCPNRMTRGDQDGYCTLTLCPDGTFTGNNGQCYDCNTPQSVGTLYVRHEGCEQCPNRYMENGYCVIDCPTDKPLKDKDGNCYSCDDPRLIKPQNSCQEVCPNRHTRGDNDFICALDLCPEETFTGADGECYSCDETRNISVVNVKHENCSQCPDRIMINNYCTPACPDEKPLLDSSGKCHACDEEEKVDVYAISDACKYCPNRVNRGMSDRYCVIDGFCPEGTFTGADGKCYDCFDQRKIDVQYVSHEGCEQCPNRTRRGDNNRYCVIDGLCPEGTFTGRNGECYSCDEEKAIDVNFVSHEGCSACINRTQINGFCYLDE